MRLLRSELRNYEEAKFLFFFYAFNSKDMLQKFDYTLGRKHWTVNEVKSSIKLAKTMGSIQRNPGITRTSYIENQVQDLAPSQDYLV